MYLDYAATTPLDPEVEEGMRALRGIFGHPGSVHQEGQRARRALEEARERAAHLLGVEPRTLLFTSGGAEANLWALLGVALARGRGHVVASAVEHASLLQALRVLERLGFGVTRLPPDPEGRIHPEALARALRPDTFLVSVMAANHEVGTLYPLGELAEVAHAHGALFHTDAAMLPGRLPFRPEEEGVDLASLSAHKFYGPKGVGLLWVRRGVSFFPRAEGTLDPVLAQGLALALEKAFRLLPEEGPRLLALTRRLEEGLLGVEGVWRQGPKEGLPGLINVGVAGVEGETLFLALDLLGLRVSVGSACPSGGLEPSHVLLAMGKSPKEALASVRFSLGRFTTEEEVEGAVAAFREAVARARA